MPLIEGTIPQSKEGIMISKICGALATDGSFYKKEKLWNGYKATSYYFELTDEWKENVELVKDWIKSLIGKEGSIKPNTGSFRYRLGSKYLVEYLHSLGFPYGEKSSIVTIPKLVLQLPRKYQLSFVSSAIMYDGTVKLDGTVEFTTISKKFRNEMVSILRKEKIHIYAFEKRFDRWSTNLRYGFSSRSFDFFMNLLEGPKRRKLELIRIGAKLSLEELLKLFPEQEHSKLPFIRILYEEIRPCVKPINFQNLKAIIESKYKTPFHRNTLIAYLNILVKSELIKRISKGWYKFEES